MRVELWLEGQNIAVEKLGDHGTVRVIVGDDCWKHARLLLNAETARALYAALGQYYANEAEAA